MDPSEDVAAPQPDFTELQHQMDFDLCFDQPVDFAHLNLAEDLQTGRDELSLPEQLDIQFHRFVGGLDDFGPDGDMLRSFSSPFTPGNVVSTTPAEATNSLPYENPEKPYPICHDETMGLLGIEKAGSLEAKTTESLNAAGELSEGDLSISAPAAIIIHGLPQSTNEASLKSLMAWSCEFRDTAGAQLAKDLFHGKANIDATAYLSVEFTSADFYFLPLSASENYKPSRQRHKWREDHLAFLEEKFLSNPKPSTSAKREFATQLGVGEQQVNTWFNNSRQRQKNGGPVGSRWKSSEDWSRDTSTTRPRVLSAWEEPLQLSKERLEELVKNRPSSKSPIERFATSLGLDENEPSPEAIEATCRQQNLLHATTQNRTLSSDSGRGHPTPGLDAGDAGSTSSAGSMHSSRSNTSFRSTGSNDFRRGRKAHRRRSQRASLPVTLQSPRYHLGVRLACARCMITASFELTNQAMPIICVQCKENLGIFSVDHGLSASFIKVRCPNRSCNHQNYQSTTAEDNEGSVQIRCLCERYNPRLGLFDYNSVAPSGLPAKTSGSTAPELCTSNKYVYHCTYCKKSYTSKYGWERHETTKHRPKELWICCSGEPIQNDACIFCALPFPTRRHFKKHWYEKCLQRDISLRTYSRKDQIVQHVRSFHPCALVREELLRQWKRDVSSNEQCWECGICGESLLRWQERLRHIAKHWERGLNMSHWTTEDVSGTANVVNGLMAEEEHYNEQEPIGMAEQAPERSFSIQDLWKCFKSALYQ